MDQSNLGYTAKNEYEFLDLSDVDDIERTRLSSALLHKRQQQQQKQRQQSQSQSQPPQQQQQQQQQLQHLQKHPLQPPLQQIVHDVNEHERGASLINKTHNVAAAAAAAVANVQPRVVNEITTSTDSECQIILSDNNNIQSNLSSISSTQNATSVTNSNPTETKQNFRLSQKKLSKQNQTKREQVLMMSPHVNSQEDLTSQQQQQQQQQPPQNQQIQNQLQPVQLGNNQTTPAQSLPTSSSLATTTPTAAAQQSQHTHPTTHSSQSQSQPIPQQLPSQSSHPTNNAASNIPSQNVQSHIYQAQSQPQYMQNYVQHMSPASSGNFYAPVQPMILSNFSASFNLHAMQSPPYYVPDNYQTGIDQQQQSTHPIQSQVPNHFSGPRRPRRSEPRGGRGYGRDAYRSRQMNSVQEINSNHTPAHVLDGPAMMTQQSSNFGPYYAVNPMAFYPNHHFISGPPHSTTAAQHATGPPLYNYAAYSPIYTQPLLYHPTMVPQQVDYLDEKSDDGMGEQIIDYAQVDPQAIGEYLPNQPPALAPQNDFSTQPANEEFMMRPQPNEFVPMKQQQQQQHQHQQQPPMAPLPQQQQPQPPQLQQQLQPNEFIADHHSPHMNMNEFVAPAQEQNTQHHHHHQQPNQQHHQHQHQQQHPAAMIDTGKVSEIPNQPDIKQQPQQEHLIESTHHHHINRDQNRNVPEPMFENVPAPSFANVLNDSHNMVAESMPAQAPQPTQVASDVNVWKNSVPKSSHQQQQQNAMLPPTLVDKNENKITNHASNINANSADGNNAQLQMQATTPHPSASSTSAIPANQQQMRQQHHHHQQHHHQQHQQQHQQHHHQSSKPMGAPNGQINGLVQTMNEKLVVHARTNSNKAQTQIPSATPHPAPPVNAWAVKKSTQSVAVSVVPSNNYQHNEMSTTTTTTTTTSSSSSASITKQTSLGSSSNSNMNNNNNSCSSNNNIQQQQQQQQPIVPKLDEQLQSSKVNNNHHHHHHHNYHQTTSTTTAAIATSTTNILSTESKSVQSVHQDVTTQQSSEMQTVPVSDMQSDEPSIFASSTNNNSNHDNSNANSKATAALSGTAVQTQSIAATAAVPAPSKTWSSLFQSANSAENSQKRPIAKVSPYTNHESKSNNPSARATTATASTSLSTSTNTPVLSYSSAASSTANSGVSRRSTPAVKSARIPPSMKPQQNSPEPSIDESSYRLGDFMLKYKVDNNSISLRPRGLANRSNYCYINAILQALMACPPFYNLMKSIPLDAPMMRFKTNTPTIDAVVELVREFSNLPNGSRLHRHRDNNKGGNKKEDVTFELVCDPSIEPTAIHKLWNSTRNDNEGRQEDAEEFLGYVLNKLNDEMLELKKLVEKPAEPVPNGMENGDGADDEGNEWQVIGTRNKGTVTRSADFGRTPVSDIFRGELRSRLQREGDHTTDVIHSFQPFFTLQLNIEKANSVKEALENFVNKDQVEGVTCSKTNQEVTAWQQMTIEKLPVVLILHLKLFDYKGDVCTKILKTVDFPIELKLDPKILSSKKYNAKQRQYRLFAVVYHDGKEASKGHYITDVYHTGYLSWIRYDDSTVKRVGEKNVLHPHMPRVPYLLYYQRSDTIPAPANANTGSNSGGGGSGGGSSSHSHHK